MFRLWAKIWTSNHLMKDVVIENHSSNRRTQKVFDCLKGACDSLDLSHPIWLDSVVKDFKIYGKTKFTKDCFIEPIDFDYLEIHVIEED